MTEAPKLKKCPACNGRGYHRCDCWPGDCICGWDDETCEECDGDGVIDLTYDYMDDISPIAMAAALLSRNKMPGHGKPAHPKPDAKKAAHRAKVKAARKQNRSRK